MTENEEREYLIDLLFESARWKVDHDEVLNGLELEIRDRLRRLSRVNTIDEDGLCQSNPTDNLPVEDEPLTGADYQDLEAAKLDACLDDKIKARRARKNANAAAYRERNVRVHINGKPVWKPRVDCVQVPTDNGHFRWEWRPGQASAT